MSRTYSENLRAKKAVRRGRRQFGSGSGRRPLTTGFGAGATPASAGRGAWGHLGLSRDRLALLRPAGLVNQKKSGHAEEQNRPDVHAARRARFDAQQDLDPERLIFIDETCLNTKMARLRRRAPRGKRLHAPLLHGHWKTTTFIGGLRLTGMDAPMLIDGPVNAENFLAYVERVLVPGLRPGDVVIMDNLGRHKSAAVRDASEPAGASPMFLPRTRDGLWEAVAGAIESFLPKECANYFTAAV